MDTAFLITAFATLFVVIDPPGLVPMFIALTSGMDNAHRATMARRACIIAFVLLTLFGLMGEALLGFIGISMSAFRIAGGILLFLTALDMLFGGGPSAARAKVPTPTMTLRSSLSPPR